MVSTNCSESVNEQFGILSRRSFPYFYELPARWKASDERVLPQSHCHIVAAKVVSQLDTYLTQYDIATIGIKVARNENLVRLRPKAVWKNVNTAPATDAEAASVADGIK